MTAQNLLHTLSERDLELGPTMESWAALLGSSAGYDLAPRNLPVDTVESFLPLATVVNLNDYMTLRRARERAQSALSDFVQLPKGWDSYNAEPPRIETGEFALKIINDILNPTMPEPQLFPTAPGGIQIEWHQNDLDLELHILGPFNCELWYRVPSTGEEDVLPITTDFKPLNDWVARLQPRR